MPTGDLTNERLGRTLSEHAVGHLKRLVGAALMLLLASVIFAGSARAQSQSSVYGTPPAGNAPGTPSGSYLLSNVERVDLYSGRVNVVIPLLKIGGRGGAGYTMSWPVEQSSWVTEYSPNNPLFNDPGHLNVFDSRYEHLAWTKAPKLEPGYLTQRTVRQEPWNVNPDDPGGPNEWKTSLTTVVFTSADGTEHTLYDAQTGGLPTTWDYVNHDYFPSLIRGRVFIARDGSGLSFVADQDLTINNTFSISSGNLLPVDENYPNGYLKTQNGTVYRFVEGHAQWIRDRNGNTTTFTYQSGVLTKVTDSTGREVSIIYGSGTLQISYYGFGEEPRTITINFGSLSSNLRPNSGYQTGPRGLLFPAHPYNGHTTGFDNRNSVYNPTVVSTIMLPNNRSFSFYYNPYGELARMVTPAGAATEYEYWVGWTGDANYPTFESGQVGNIRQFTSQSPDVAIYRRLRERREYVNGSAATATHTTRYTRFELLTKIQEEHIDADGATVLSRAEHYFHGNPVMRLFTSIEMGYPLDPLEGKEVKVENLDFNDNNTVLASTENVWAPDCAPGDLSPMCTWPRSPFLKRVTTSLLSKANNQYRVSKREFARDQYDNVTDTYEYDFGDGVPGPLVRHSHTDYLNDANYTSTDVNLRSLPSQQWVSTDLNGSNKVSRIDFTYDEFGLEPCPEIIRQNGVCPDIVGHDGAFTTGYTTRGNPTRVTSYADAAGGTGAVTATTHYDIAGNAVSLTDADGNTSYLSYLDSFSDGNNGRYTFAYPTSMTTAAPNPTSIPRPGSGGGEFGAGEFGSTTGLTSTAVYDFNTGLGVRLTDANGKTTAYDYADPLERLKRVDRPDGGRTTYNYVDEHQCGAYVETRTLLDDSGRELASWQFFDGLGRPYLSERGEYQEAGAPFLRVDTVYDALGRVSQISNPYRTTGCTTTPARQWTTSEYDALGRVKAVTTPDGAKVYMLRDGERTLVTDQAKRQRIGKTDALGRVSEVWEVRSPDAATGTESISFPIPNELASAVPGVAAGYKTTYVYDALGNLRKVDQGGRQRFYKYDSLSRLTRSKSPEQAINGALAVADPVTQNGQWTTAYDYDPNGNLTSRTDARGVQASYFYDGLGRNIIVHYAGGGTSTPDVLRHFDNPGSTSNGLGRLWRTETVGLSATSIDSYDVAGRPKQQTQKFWKGTSWDEARAYGTSLEYNLAGGVTAQNYPSGHRVEYQYDAAGRLGDNGPLPAFKGTLGDNVWRTYASQVSYGEFGGIQQEQFGTQTPLYHKLHYNQRGQLFDIRLSTQPLASSEWDWNRAAIINYYSGNYAWEGDASTPPSADNNGNLRRQQIRVPTDDQISSYTLTQQTYGYDALNRLSSVTEAAGTNNAAVTDSFKQTYDYDRWGNRTINAAETWLGNPSAPPSDSLNEKQFDRADLANTNRLYAPGDTAIQDAGQRRMRYDAAGNLVYDNYTGRGARTYDAEGRMTSAADEYGGTTVYAYDGEGRRVRRSVSAAGEVWQVYGPDGKLLAEYAKDALHTQPWKEYGYRGGELLVTVRAASSGWGPPPSFTGPDPLSTGGQIKLENLTELRGAVNQLRQHVGLSPYSFTVDPNPQSGVTTVKAEHIRQLRVALEEARSRLGLSTGGYAHPTLSEHSSLIYAIDFQELREQIRGAWHTEASGVDVRWLVADQLGTPRMIVGQMGSLSSVKRHDYLPFGEELSAGLSGRTPAQGYVGSDDIRQKFTGYERDSETRLDFAQARYYASAQGRFTSVDPLLASASIKNPQSFNPYSYALNNPYRFTDPLGLSPRKPDDQEGQQQQPNPYEGLTDEDFGTPVEIYKTYFKSAQEWLDYTMEQSVRELKEALLFPKKAFNTLVPIPKPDALTFSVTGYYIFTFDLTITDDGDVYMGGEFTGLPGITTATIKGGARSESGAIGKGIGASAQLVYILDQQHTDRTVRQHFASSYSESVSGGSHGLVGGLQRSGGISSGRNGGPTALTIGVGTPGVNVGPSLSTTNPVFSPRDSVGIFDRTGLFSSPWFLR